MKAMNSDWYRTIWSLDIKEQSWVEDTEKQVAFLIRALGLIGNERILDLGCGFGRHALAFARKGYRVVGVDITRAFVDDAGAAARAEGLGAEFIHADIRELRFRNAFDVVLNMADGAIGYLESDEENLKIFDVVAAALRPGGKHFLDVCSAEHAEHYFPKRHWEVGTKSVSLPEFDWDSATRRMLFASWEIPLGGVARPPVELEAASIRLYSMAELAEILTARGLEVQAAYSDYEGAPVSPKYMQTMLYSRKR